MKSMIAYTHLIEFLPGRECKISGLFMFLDGLVVVITPFMIHFISTDLNFLFRTSLIFNGMSLLCFMLMRVPESTKFLIMH